MSSLLKKIFSSSICAMVLLVSMLGICKQALDVTCISCAQHEVTMLDAAIHKPGADCGRISQDCSGHSGDHMTTFASLYPATSADMTGTLLILCSIIVVAWVLRTREYIIDAERVKARLKNYLRNLASSPNPSFFILAFSRGILHSKIYA